MKMDVYTLAKEQGTGEVAPRWKLNDSAGFRARVKGLLNSLRISSDTVAGGSVLENADFHRARLPYVLSPSRRQAEGREHSAPAPVWCRSMWWNPRKPTLCVNLLAKIRLISRVVGPVVELGDGNSLNVSVKEQLHHSASVVFRGVGVFTGVMPRAVVPEQSVCGRTLHVIHGEKGHRPTRC